MLCRMLPWRLTRCSLKLSLFVGQVEESLIKMFGYNFFFNLSYPLSVFFSFFVGGGGGGGGGGIWSADLQSFMEIMDSNEN